MPRRSQHREDCRRQEDQPGERGGRHPLNGSARSLHPQGAQPPQHHQAGGRDPHQQEAHPGLRAARLRPQEVHAAVQEPQVDGAPSDQSKYPPTQSLCYQLFKGVEACHTKKILHRDLKPQNLLVSSSKVLKLADFGLARASGIPVKSYTHEVVTLWYRPPDVLLGSQKYSTEIDIWSAGCIFAELVNLKPLFAGQNEKDQLDKIFKVFGTPNSQSWPGCESLPQWNNHEFADYQAQELSEIVPGLEESGMDLLKVGS